MTTSEDLLIGRRDEIRTLHSVFSSKTAEFIAVYGRRRVGKTFLIKMAFKEKDAIFFHVSGTKDATMKDQIYDFTRVVESAFYQRLLHLSLPKNWKEAFELLTAAIDRESKNRKVILFFDELPWFASKRSQFIQALDYYWNRFWSDMPHIKLIVCGSAAAWMLDHVISHKGGLHNRITGRIALYPFNLLETKEFLLSKGMKYNDTQTLEIFMITGGIPYYLNFVKKHFSVAQNIDALCFQRNGQLVEEFDRLFASLFSDPEMYESLVKIIAAKRSGIERMDILKKLKNVADGGRFNEKLNALEQSGFIVGFIPYGFLKRKMFYRLIDEYTLFYLDWILPARSSIRKLDTSKGYWLDKQQTPAWRAWAGYAFESVCYKHIAEIRRALHISPTALVGSWQYVSKKRSDEQGAQIDLLFDRDDGVITVCEIKHTTQPYQLTKEEAFLMKRKIEVFNKRTRNTKQVQLVLITNAGIKETIYSEEMVVQHLRLSDLMG